ncbi:MAG: mycothiol synthase [Propionibacteriaceae bacterium]|nr:mycothiol synthase [Propionibacteriaceae bacterium]
MIQMDNLSAPLLASLEELLERIEEADGVRPTNESADLVIAGSRPGSFLFVTEGDDVVGFAVVDARDATIQLGVDPAHRRRGHGSALLMAALESHPQHTVWAFGTREGATALSESMGLRPVRELLKMERPLAEEAWPVVPDGWRIRAWQPEDAEGVVATNASAFSHHPEQGKLTLGEFNDLTEQPWFSADGLLLATPTSDPSNVAGFHWTKRQDETTGEVYVLAVDPEHAGHGLGRVLLEAGLAHLRATGCTRVILFVEASENRVVRLYQSASFVTSNTDTSYRT